MRLPATLLFMAAFLAPDLSGQAPGYYRFPTIHGDQVVFSAEGDLWKVGAGGGLASRLTRDEGNESYARFSPDGRWIAFSGSYQGNLDVYVIPASGGEPRRLTWHPGADVVIGWQADSKNVVFRSHRRSAHRDSRAFTIGTDGGQPRLLDIGPVALLSFHEDGGRIAFNRFAHEGTLWKRYRGGTAQDVWVGDLKSGVFERVTDWEGTDRFPLWAGDRLLFLSDRNGSLNFFSRAESGELEQLTRHTSFDPRWPDHQEGRVVYMLGGDLHLLDLGSGADRKIEIQLPSDRIRHRPRMEDAAKTLDTYALGEDGKRIVLSARGEVWHRPVKPGRTISLTRTPGIRERAPELSPDGKQVLCISDETGEQQLALLDAAGREEGRILEQQRIGWMNPPTWSPQGTHVAWSDLTLSLFLMDVASQAVTTVATSTAGEIGSYRFSPDGRWLAYAMVDDNYTSTLYIHDTKAGNSVAVTTPFTSDGDPVWDPEGRFLYFISNRSINPMLGQADLQHIVTETGKVCALILRADGRSPFLPDELLVDPAAAEKADDDEKEKDGEKSKTPEIHIDFDGIASRVVEFPIAGGNYGGLAATRGKVYYVSQPTPGLLDMALFSEDPTPRNQLHVFDLKTKKSEVAIASLRDYGLSGDGSKIAWRVGREILVADTAGKISAEGAERIDPSSLPLKVDPPQEWAQIFREAWRLQRDFFWAENLVHVDWDAAGKKYGGLLPRISTRDELNDLIGQMMFELGTSHTYTIGGDIESGDRVATGLLGADLELDEASGLLRFETVLRPEVWETSVEAPLTMNHVDVREGDHLFAIDGIELGAADNLHAALENLAGRQVLLTVGRTTNRSAARDVQIEALRSDSELRYLDWCRRNREYVDRISGGQLGYFHMPDMMGRGLVQFIKGFYPQIQKKGLVIDARYNGGGFVSQMVIERLMRTPIAYSKPRRGPVGTNPARTHIGHKVALTNQLAGSDGDIFPKTFQLRNLGPVIGMRTWGGVVGISPGRRHVDGGMTTQPTSAWWEPEGGFSLENTGVTPDIEVDILPDDWLNARDPQLDRAIEELKQRIRDNPVELPETPEVPDKSVG